MTYLDKRLHVEQWVPDHSLTQHWEKSLSGGPRVFSLEPSLMDAPQVWGMCWGASGRWGSLGLHHADTLPQLFLGLPTSP